VSTELHATGWFRAILSKDGNWKILFPLPDQPSIGSRSRLSPKRIHRGSVYCYPLFTVIPYLTRRVFATGYIKIPSQNQHRISITVKPVLFADRFIVSLFDQGIASEGSYQYQERGPRKMKIGQHRINGMKLVRRADE